MAKRSKERRKTTTSCGAVVWRYNDGLEVLLIKQFEHKESWGIPKGHIDDGETIEQCARREVREEAGVDIQLGTRLNDIKVQLRNEDKTVVSFLAEPVGSHEPRHDDPDSEVADARWFSVNAMPKIHEYQRGMIEGAIELLEESAPWHQGEETRG